MRNFQIQSYVATFHRISNTIFYLKNQLGEGIFFIFSQSLVVSKFTIFFQTLSISITMHPIKENLPSIALSNICDKILV